MDYTLKIKQTALRVEVFVRGLFSRVFSKNIRLHEVPIQPCGGSNAEEIAEEIMDKLTESSEVIGSPKDHTE